VGKGCSEAFGNSSALRACSRRTKRRIRSSDRYCPYCHSFVSIVFVRLSRLVVRTLEPGLAITTLVGKTVACKRVVCECPIGICGRVLPANLVVLPKFSYDVIIGMDWLARHLTIIDCALKQVTLTPWGEGQVTSIES
jgi:hypothetical protein